jgi:hypothetical protein
MAPHFELSTIDPNSATDPVVRPMGDRAHREIAYRPPSTPLSQLGEN